MKIAIVGSREFPALAAVRFYVLTLPPETVIVSGGAPGVDRTAEHAAEDAGLPKPLIIRAKWRRPDGSVDLGAGFARNGPIVDAADRVVAFWDWKSRGTFDTITKALAAGKLWRLWTCAGGQIGLEWYGEPPTAAEASIVARRW